MKSNKVVPFKKTKATFYIVAFINIDVLVQNVDPSHEKSNEVIPREFLFKKTKTTFTLCLSSILMLMVKP